MSRHILCTLLVLPYSAEVQSLLHLMVPIVPDTEHSGPMCVCNLALDLSRASVLHASSHAILSFQTDLSLAQHSVRCAAGADASCANDNAAWLSFQAECEKRYSTFARQQLEQVESHAAAAADSRLAAAQ